MVNIWNFIAKDNRAIASRFIRQLEKHFSSLLFQPEIGPRRDYLAKDLRVHFYRNYALYYRFTDAEVIIIRVVHGARDARLLEFSGN